MPPVPARNGSAAPNVVSRQNNATTSSDSIARLSVSEHFSAASLRALRCSLSDSFCTASLHCAIGSRSLGSMGGLATPGAIGRGTGSPGPPRGRASEKTSYVKFEAPLGPADAWPPGPAPGRRPHPLMMTTLLTLAADFGTSEVRVHANRHVQGPAAWQA